MTSIALYFGSFNPVHAGHLAIARYVIDKKLAERVWFVLSKQNPLKDKSVLMDDDVRQDILNKEIDNLKKDGLGDVETFSLCTLELSLPTPSYTIDTLHILKQKYPNHKFSILMGADNLQNINKWKKFEEILENYQLLVYPREGAVVNDFFSHPNVIYFTEADLLPYSSTSIRENLTVND